MAFSSSDGATVYVAALGSSRVAVLDATALGRLLRARDDRVGGGPTGVALDEPRDRLYVMSRFEQRVGIVTSLGDLQRARADVPQVSLRFDPTPPAIRQGQRFL